MPERDPGLQPERTSLAWQRTALSGTVLAVLLARIGVRGGSVADVIAASCAALAVLLAAVFSRGVRAGKDSRRQLWAVTLAVVGAGVFATVGLLS